jgi:hypothetical protein
VLVGILSSGPRDCDGLASATRIDAHMGFIKRYISATLPRSAPPGARCYTDDHCRGGRCLRPGDAPHNGYCSDACAGDAQCVAPMRCDRLTGACRYALPSPGALGALCQEESDCGAGVCARAGDEPARCRAACYGSAIGCAADERCRRDRLAPARFACFPGL